MARFVFFIALALGDDAVTQVGRTLDNLLASIEDENRNEENAFSSRMKWCSSTGKEGETRLAGFEDQLAQASADVQEVQAAADEIQAATQTLRNELNTSKGTAQRSLQEQLSSELPLLSSKRTAATELTRKTVDLRHVVAAEKQALSDVQASCDAVKKQHDKQMEARMDAHSLLEKAKSLLGEPAPVSFVQVELAQAAATQTMQDQQARGGKKLQKLQDAPVDPLVEARDHLASLVKDLDTTSADASKSACQRELKTNKLALVWKQDELSRIAAEQTAHVQAIEEADNEMKEVGAASEKLRQHSEDLKSIADQDQAKFEKAEKDHALLEKVVSQAVAVLKESSRTQAKDLLTKVSSVLAQQRADLTKGQNDLAPKLERAQRSVAGALKAVDTEKNHLELAQSQHKVMLADMQEQTDAAKDELDKVQQYVNELQKSCQASPEDTKRRREEVETVQDAMRSIGGDAPVVVHTPEAPPSGEMSPLQRAAYEMGVAQS